MLLSKKAWLFIAGLALVLVMAPAPLCKAGLAYWATHWLGARVDIEAAEFSWWPTQLVLHGVSVTNPLKPEQNALGLARVQAEIDLLASLSGTLQIPLLQITDVQVASPRAVSGALPGVEPRRFFVTGEAAAFRLPVFDLPAGDDFIATESIRYQERITTFRHLLREQLSLWRPQVAQLPADTAVDAYRARAATLKRGKSLSADAARAARQSLSTELSHDILQLQVTRKALLAQWQQLRRQYTALRQMPTDSIKATKQHLGIADADLSRLGQALLREKIQEWLNTTLAVHQLLVSPVREGASSLRPGASPDEADPLPRLLIKKTLISGRFRSGMQPDDLAEDPIRGEILNLCDMPQTLADPLTLHVQAGGTATGVVQLSAMLDHRVTGKDIDRFNFSLKSAPLHRWTLVGDGAMNVVADSGVLSIDLAGSIEQHQGLDINLSSQLTGLALEVTAKNTDNRAASVLSDALRTTTAMTMTARANGNLNQPALQLTSSLDDVLATALRNALGDPLETWQQSLQQRLDARLLEQLSALDADLSEATAMLATVEKRLRASEDLQHAWQR